MEYQRQLMRRMLDNILGNNPKLDVSIAVANMDNDDIYNKIGYQVMTDDDFFNWYCYVRPDDQFHETPMLAVQEYLKYRLAWLKSGSPKPY